MDFLRQLQLLGVQLSSSGDKLRVKAGRGIITPQLREALEQRKPELLRILSAPAPRAQVAHVWRAQIDGAGLAIIDPDRLDRAAMQAVLEDKFGAGRISRLELHSLNNPRGNSDAI